MCRCWGERDPRGGGGELEAQRALPEHPAPRSWFLTPFSKARARGPVGDQGWAETAGMSQEHLVLQSESGGVQEPQRRDRGSSGGHRM